MEPDARSTLTFVLAWLLVTALTPFQLVQAQEAARPAAAKQRQFSGRVVDGLGRPFAGVTIEVVEQPGDRQMGKKLAVQSGPDGRFSIPAVNDQKEVDVWIKKQHDGILMLVTLGEENGDLTIEAQLDREKLHSLSYVEGPRFDQGLREILASEDFDQAFGFFFSNQKRFRPAMRRIISDTHVGDRALCWLELLGDPGDADLFPKGRRYVPKQEVKETDFVEAVRTTARQRNFFSSDPEPRIDFESIVFSDDLNSALVDCGINCAGLTGVYWRFVFIKNGKVWELRSAQETGRG